MLIELAAESVKLMLASQVYLHPIQGDKKAVTLLSNISSGYAVMKQHLIQLRWAPVISCWVPRDMHWHLITGESTEP